MKKPDDNKKYQDAIDQASDYARIISTISDDKKRYARFVIQAIVHSIDHSRMRGKFSIIKKGHHCIRIEKEKEKDFCYTNDVMSDGRDIVLVQEVITIERFVRLAIKKKAQYIAKLGLTFPQDLKRSLK